MFLLMYLLVICVVYINAFKGDFTDEHLNKATPFVAVVSIIILLICIVGSIGGK